MPIDIPRRTSPDLFPPVKSHHIDKAFAKANPFAPAGAKSTDSFAKQFGFVLPNAWWLAELSLLAYADANLIRAELANAELSLVDKPISGPSTQCFVAEGEVQGEGFAVVAFRGTEVFLLGRDPLIAVQSVIADLGTDVQAALVAAPSPARGRVHQGFRAALDEVFDELKERLAQVRPGAKIWFTGHSLGGALAILAAARLSGIQGVYVYGAPRVGNAAFGKDLSPRTIRFVHGSDAVTQLPKVGLLLEPGLLASIFSLGVGRYQPDGKIVAFDRGGQLRRGGLPGAMGVGTGGLPALILRRLDQSLTNDLIDHAPIFYVLHLRNLVEVNRQL